MNMMYKFLRGKIKSKWRRVLPYGDYFVDRWEKSKYLGFGKNSSIYDNSFVIGNVIVGENTWVGPNTMLDGSGGLLSIGDGCSISTGVQIYTHNTVLLCVSGGKNSKVVEEVKIGNNCYIGPGVIIGKGVHLGDSCVVCSNSYVNKSYDSNSIIAGCPSRLIGTVVIDEKGLAKMCFNICEDKGI